MVSILAKCALAGATALMLSTAVHAANVVTKNVDLGALGVPSATNYGTVFTGSGPYTSPDIATLGVTLTAADTFYENYVFVVPEATVVSLTSTVSLANFLNISGLQARLYEGDLNSVITGTAGPALVMGWGESFTAGISTVMTSLIAPTELDAGSYVLQVRGDVTGAFGGSYVGIVNISPVPEPETYALFIGGLAAIGMMLRRRNTQG